jgi:hypothetical protein
MMEEKRKHTRIPLRFKVELEFKTGAVYKGYTKDMSFRGACIILDSNHTLTPGQKCSLTLFLQDKKGISIRFFCQIIHINKKNIGLNYLSIEGLEGYEHYKNLMISNHEQPDYLLKELSEHPGLIVE